MDSYLDMNNMAPFDNVLDRRFLGVVILESYDVLLI